MPCYSRRATAETLVGTTGTPDVSGVTLGAADERTPPAEEAATAEDDGQLGTGLWVLIGVAVVAAAGGLGFLAWRRLSSGR